MRIFALETNVEKVKAQFVSPDEPEVFTLRTHHIRVIIHVLPIVGLYIVLLGIIAFLALNDLLSPGMVLWSVWLATAYIGLWALKRYVEWKYDVVIFTTDKLVMVNSGLFHQKVYPMHYEHAVSATAQSQLLGLFGIGRIQIQMKDIPDTKETEGITDAMDLRRINIDYIQDAAAVASRITDVFTDFQRRKMKLGTIMVPEARVTAVQAAAEQQRIQEMAHDTVNPDEQRTSEQEKQAAQEHVQKTDEVRRRLVLLEGAEG